MILNDHPKEIGESWLEKVKDLQKDYLSKVKHLPQEQKREDFTGAENPNF
jgi:hypothetical protein